MTWQPLISCLCISHKRPVYLKNAIECFQAQTYTNKEMVIIGHADDVASKNVVESFKTNNIVFKEAPKLSKGELRNLSIDNASGEYFCQWDDDDWHHDRRLEIQFQQMIAGEKQASVLAYWLMLDRVNKKAYLSSPYAFSRSLLCNRAFYDLGMRYENISKNEEMGFMTQLLAIHCPFPVVMPQLYIYIYHGKNTMEADYFQVLYRQSQELSDNACQLIENAIKDTYSKKEASVLLSCSELLGELDYFNYARVPETEYKNIDVYLERLQSREVVCGPFKGLKYARFESAGSTILPKLIGSYEHEISTVLDEIIGFSYDTILNIGCAEGYYAVGLALKCAGARVYGYDIDGKARDLCLEMARLNGVDDRLSVHSVCTDGMLADFRFVGKSLIICDCEGAEMALFTENNISNISNCDLLIETHDFVNINISTQLARLFRSSHEIIVIKSTDDFQKAKTYSFFPFEDLTDLNERKILYGEDRPCIMEWLWLKSKTLHASQLVQKKPLYSKTGT